MNRRARYDAPVMVVLLAVVVLGGWWGLADGITSDDDAPPQLDFTSAPETSEYKPGLAVDVYRPDGPGPFAAVLLVHGGGLVVGERGDLASTAQLLAAEGVLAATIDYTLNGTEPPARDDVADAYEWLTELDDVDPARVAVLGQSAGARLANWFGFGTNEPRALVLVSTPGYLIDRITRRAPETLIVHGENDLNIPVEFARDFADVLTQKHVRHELLIGEGASHFSVLAQEWPAIASWLIPRLERS